MKVHFIQQEAWVEPGEYLAWAQRRGHELSFTRCWLHDELPAAPDADLLIVLGGCMSPETTKQECPFYDAAAEMRLIRQYAEAGRAVIGVCLGAQLLGQALGARYAHSPEKEIGPVRAWLTEEGRRDPFLKGFPAVFDAGAWHNDMPGLTEGAAILAASEGCPRQIVRYGKYVYGFQTHMEFTHEIVEAGLRETAGALPAGGRFVQTPEALLAYDYTDMNRLLSSFLDALAEEYRKPSPARMLEKMITFSEGNLHDIDHLLRVWAYARAIGEQEGLDADTQLVLEAAAITHDIACPLCREKYGRADGKHQEEEGAPMARDFLADSGMSAAQIERVAYLVGHHHSFTGVDGVDWQILLEADWLANAAENGWGAEKARHFLNGFAKTAAGRRLIRSVFLPRDGSGA